MNDIVPDGNLTPTSVLAKQGVTAIGGIAGGIVCLVMGALPPVVGIVVGGAAAVIGISAILSKDPGDKKPGILIAAAGALAVFSKVGMIKPIAGTLLSIGALGLLGLGIWNGIKFLKGLKKRG
jgi:hypothetical protein